MSSSLEVAQTILHGFDKHYRLFREVSEQAKGHFEKADWSAVRQASRTRIDMYDQRVREAVSVLTERFPHLKTEEGLWAHIKTTYIGLLYEHKQPECAETFFNSVASRVLDRRYHRNDYIFSRPAISTEHLDGEEPTYRCYYSDSPDPIDRSFREILLRFELALPFQDLDRDIGYVKQAIREAFPRGWARHPNFQIQVLRSLFFRNRAAYAVGRVLDGARTFPFVVPLLRDATGSVYVDTILLDERNIGRLFSLSHVYFMVDMEVPAAYVEFLQTVVSTMPKAEIYTLLGLQKQGKTIFFRDLQQHLKHSSDRFVLAPGIKGMVMLVFTLPSFPYVFKVIRDWFEPPKDADRRSVEGRYQLVKGHDRVGRMTDTLEFTHVAFPWSRFDEALKAEIVRLIPGSIEIDAERIVIKHLYMERRLVPLDMHLRSADDARRRDSIREYGDAIKDLAAANIFPGDLLIKNFGVTRYGRVLFYDYDEVCYLTDCRFHHLPVSRDDDDEMSSESRLVVDTNDIFPAQFPTFLFPPGTSRDTFLEFHGDLCDPNFWTAQNERLLAGQEGEVFTYGPEARFSLRYGG